MTPRVGDVVHVRLAVASVAPQAIGLRRLGHDCVVYYCEPDELVHIEPAPLKVGDRVMVQGDQTKEWTIAAVDDDGFAWLKREGNHRQTARLEYLKRVP